MTRMMKKALSLLMAALLVLSFCTVSSAEENKVYRIGICSSPSMVRWTTAAPDLLRA